GEDRRSTDAGRLDAGVCGGDACGAFGACGGAHRTVMHQRSGGYRFGAAERRSEEIEEAKSIECGGFVGSRDSLDSRRNVDQRIVYLTFARDCRRTLLQDRFINEIA